MLWFVEKTEICNFAYNSITFSCKKSLSNVIKSLQPHLKIALNWFKDNRMMANPRKFQFKALNENTISQLQQTIKRWNHRMESWVNH